MPVRRAFPNDVKLSGPRKSFSGVIVNGVSSDCDRCALLREVSTFSISPGLSIFRHYSEESDGRMLFQRMEVSIVISINLMSHDSFSLVWCLMEGCICC